MNAQVLKDMSKRFKQGRVFRMTKPSFVSNVKQQHNNAPKSEVVSMLHTTWAPVLSSAAKPTMAEPSIPIAMCLSIIREQLFDVMGIVREVSEVRSGGRTSSGQERVRCTCKITDGSKMPGTDQTCDLPITIFEDKPSSVSSDVTQCLNLGVSTRLLFVGTHPDGKKHYGIAAASPPRVQWSF